MNNDFVSVKFERPDNELIEISLVKDTGEPVYVGSANHDEHGWAGMDAVKKLAVAFATNLGLDVNEQ